MGNAVQLREAPREESASPAKEAAATRPDGARGLLLIGLFKLSKSLGCVLLGAMCFHLIHRDLGDLAMQIIDWLNIDSTGKVAGLLMDKADLISGHQLRVTGGFSFAGAVIYAVEGTGLMLCKVWAEYVTVVLTALGLPWEIFEMVRHFSPWKLGLFAANLLVLAYLIWLLRRKRQREHPA